MEDIQLWNGGNDYVKCIPDKNDLHFYALCIRLFYVVEYGLFRVCEWNSLYHYYVRVPSGRSRALPWPCLGGHGVVHTSTVLVYTLPLFPPSNFYVPGDSSCTPSQFFSTVTIQTYHHLTCFTFFIIIDAYLLLFPAGCMQCFLRFVVTGIWK